MTQSTKKDQIELALENLLANCKVENFALTDEDLEWVTAKARGKEIQFYA